MNQLGTTGDDATSLRGVEAKMFGCVTVLVAMRGDQVVAVEADSIARALGFGDRHPLLGYLRTKQRKSSVTVGDRQATRNLIGVALFIAFCQMNPEPALEAFRVELSKIIQSLQDRGGYIGRDAGPAAYLDDENKDDPLSQVIVTTLLTQKEQLRQGREIARLGADLDTINRKIGNGPNGWTVVCWFNAHNKKNVLSEVVRDEGMECRKVCIRLGIEVPPDDESVCSGGSFPARIWPKEVIKTWWPECCKRHGWPVIWNIKL